MVRGQISFGHADLCSQINPCFIILSINILNESSWMFALGVINRKPLFCTSLTQTPTLAHPSTILVSTHHFPPSKHKGSATSSTGTDHWQWEDIMRCGFLQYERFLNMWEPWTLATKKKKKQKNTKIEWYVHTHTNSISRCRELCICSNIWHALPIDLCLTLPAMHNSLRT